MLRRLLLPLTLLATLLPAAVASASLRVDVLTPFGLTVTQSSRGGGTIVLENRALGFSTPQGFFHVTEVVGRRKVGGNRQLTLATDDPAGRRLTLRIDKAGNGIQALRATVPGATSVRIGFQTRTGERYLGFGERSDSVDQRGRAPEMYVSDGPFSKDSRVIVSNTIPPAGYRDRDDASYYPIPWLLSTGGYGALVDNDETSRFDIGKSDNGAWTAEVDADSLRLRLFEGPTPASALRRFTNATGRQPAPSAPWAYGPWFQTGQPSRVPVKEEQGYLDKLRKADAPVSVAETQTRYLPCGLDRGNERYEQQRVRAFQKRGLAVLTYVNPMLCERYEPLFSAAAGSGALQKGPSGAPRTFDSFVGGVGPNGFSVLPVAQFDFLAKAGRDAYGETVDRLIKTGHDGWMEDFGEYTPADVVAPDGTPSAQLHNRYPRDYHCAVAAHLKASPPSRPVVRFQRSGWTGAAKCASNVWGGDPTTGFGFDGLSSSLTNALSMGLSGVSRWGSDVGGYDTIGNDPKLTPELLKRWIQFGAVSGVMRTKLSGIAIPQYERPQIFDKGIVGVWRRYAKLHTQLYPYIAAADKRYREQALPLMEHLALEDPSDPKATAAEDEFLFGPDLLAAPIVKQGARSRRVYLPRGRWLDFAKAVDYSEQDGSYHVAAGRTTPGKRTVRVRAPLDTLPLFVRSGAVLPLLPATVDTLADYTGKGVTRLKDRAGELTLLAFPRGESTSRMYEGERLHSVVRGREWRLRIAGSRTRTYRVEAATAELRFRPCRVSVGGKLLRRGAWRLTHGGDVLELRARTKRAIVRVRGCGQR